MNINEIFQYVPSFEELCFLHDFKFLTEFKQGSVQLELEIDCYTDHGLVGYHVHGFKNENGSRKNINIPFQAMQLAFPELEVLKWRKSTETPKARFLLAPNVLLKEYTDRFSYIVANEENLSQIAILDAKIDKNAPDVLVLSHPLQIRLDTHQTETLQTQLNETDERWHRTHYEFHRQSGKLFDDGGEIKDAAEIAKVVQQLSFVDSVNPEELTMTFKN